MKYKWILWTIITAIITSIISYFFGQGACNNQYIVDTANAGVIANTLNWNVTQNIKQLSPLEIENEQHWQDDQAKISWFFKYWNIEEYHKARNNIEEDISWKFTDDNMKEFRNNMNNVFEIMKIEKRWKIINSDWQIATKHNVELTYHYKWSSYNDKLFIQVTRNKEDPKQHHIIQMKCDWTNWPFCEFLEWDL